jgi:hypothetical protein
MINVPSAIEVMLSGNTRAPGSVISVGPALAAPAEISQRHQNQRAPDRIRAIEWFHASPLLRIRGSSRITA